jgi:acetoin utilization protein AcuB
MRREVHTVTSDTPVVEAQRIVSDKDLRILCVVDEGRLRGVLTRKNLNEAAQCVARTQNIHEVEYFVDRLKVKDLMNRMVKTVEAADTVERVMLRGRMEEVSTFPVVENGQLVGLVSEMEIFNSMLEVLGVAEHLQGLSLEPVELDPGLLGRVAMLVEGAGGRLEALFTMRVPGSSLKKIVIRFESEDSDKVCHSLEQAGYKVFERQLDTAAGVEHNHC